MKNLKAAREAMGLTQSDLAERLGTTQQSVGRWEKGKAEPSLAALRDLAIILCTTVDHLLGREPVIDHQTTNPIARYYGDDSGYWGNVGIRYPGSANSTWYPISTATMRSLFREIQSIDETSWLTFATLNNKMVIFKPSLVRSCTFLDEAEDGVEGDWEIGPADVEGLPKEFYECLEELIHSEPSPEDGFSDRLVESCRDFIKDRDLDEDALMEMCLQSRVRYTDGPSKAFTVSEERMAEVMSNFELGIEEFGITMLHLDDSHGDHSVFVPLGLVSALEFPLVHMERGLRELHGLEDEDEDDE